MVKRRDVAQRIQDSAEESRDHAKNCKGHGPLHSRAAPGAKGLQFSRTAAVLQEPQIETQWGLKECSSHFSVQFSRTETQYIRRQTFPQT